MKIVETIKDLVKPKPEKIETVEDLRKVVRPDVPIFVIPDLSKEQIKRDKK
jgi:hypothetical protein